MVSRLPQHFGPEFGAVRDFAKLVDHGLFNLRRGKRLRWAAPTALLDSLSAGAVAVPLRSLAGKRVGHRSIAGLAHQQSFEQSAVAIADFRTTGSTILLEPSLHLSELIRLDDRLVFPVKDGRPCV